MIAPTIFSFLAGINVLMALAMAFGKAPGAYVACVVAILLLYRAALRHLGRSGFWVLYAGTISGLTGFVAVIFLVDGDDSRLGPGFFCLGLSAVAFMCSAWEARRPLKQRKDNREKA
jgi:hypothetical protein